MLITFFYISYGFLSIIRYMICVKYY